MRFHPAEPDIATVFNRIEGEDIDLQPDFQRGEVWSIAKQQRLIDTILRGWVVPPILLIALPDSGKQQVLDGQQRLAAIRDFKRNEFPVDGFADPLDEDMQKLHGLFYNQLPHDITRKFDKTTIRIYEISDYLPEEPAEIFFRLNQPTSLTPAEKRNAFFGPVRDQIRTLVEDLKAASVESILGFSNSRMAFDDVISKMAYVLEQGSLKKKVTAAAVNFMYRRNEPLDSDVSARLRATLHRSIDVLRIVTERGSLRGDSTLRLSKATYFSWLIFFARVPEEVLSDTLAKFFVHFERARTGVSRLPISDTTPAFLRWGVAAPEVDLMRMYSDRATARVADVSSVILRDFVLWYSWAMSSRIALTLVPGLRRQIEGFLRHATPDSSDRPEATLIDYLERIDWGEVI